MSRIQGLRGIRPVLVTCTAILVTAVLSGLFAEAAAVVPLIKPPTWRSTDTDYSTGGVLVDLDGNGYLDLVTGNGNDMAQQPIRINYNYGGVLESVPSWSSSDVGYNCHIDLGDFDGDGDLDLAVALLGDPGAAQRDKIYENTGGAFTLTPVWTSGDLDNSFDLAWGDMDGDGDLDLAVACGETYTNNPQKSKIYRNDGGVITSNAVWRTGPVDYTLDVAWGDVDRDGDLDLACANEFGPNRIYFNNGAGLDSIPGWESSVSNNSLQLDFGDADGDGWLDLAVANNAQLGGVSNVVIYYNSGGTLETTPSWASTDAKTYYSAVSFGDPDNDGDLDLAAGGWWEDAVVFENLGGSLETVASFGWKFPSPARGLVVESTVWADLDNSGSTTVYAEANNGDGTARTFYTDYYPVRSIDEVRVGGLPLPAASYCYDLDEGWIALSSAPPAGTGNIEIDYVYSIKPDLIVTNWDPDDPNICFLNDVATTVASAIPVNLPLLLPNYPEPFNPATIIPIELPEESRIDVTVFDLRGRQVRALYAGRRGAGRHEFAWDGTDETSRQVGSGVYFYRVEAGALSETRRMTLIR